MADEQQQVLENPPQESNGSEQAGTAGTDTTPNPALSQEGKPNEDTGKAGGSEAGSGIPETYELTLPEGIESADDIVASVSEYAKENGLTQEQAQAQLNREITAEQSFLDAHVEQIKAINEQWLEEAAKHPEYGGEKWETTKARLDKMMGTYFNEKARELFNKSGLGNNPDLIEGFHKIGLLDAEDTFEMGQKPKKEQSRAEVMYPNG